MPNDLDLNAWDLLALSLSALGLALGLGLVFRGRLAREQWRRTVEVIIAGTLGAMIGVVGHLILAPPSVPHLDVWIGYAVGVVAYLIAGGFKKEFLGLFLGLVLFFLSYAGLSKVPGVDSVWVPGLGGCAAFLTGYRLVELYYAHMLVVTTSFTGASWVATSIIGFVQVLMAQSPKHLLHQLIGFVLPAVAMALSILGLGNPTELLLILLWLGLFLVTLTTGLRAQLKDIHVSPPSKGSAIPLPRWLVVASTLAYGALLVAVRVYGLGHSADTP